MAARKYKKIRSCKIIILSLRPLVFYLKNRINTHNTSENSLAVYVLS